MAGTMKKLRFEPVSRVSILGFLAIGLIACAGGAVGPAYGGTDRAASEVAVLQTMSNARVVGIDGVRVSGRSFTLRPGRYEVWLYIAEPHGRASRKIWSHCRVAFEAEAGQRYQSRVRTRPDATSHFRRLEPGITDSDGVLLAPVTGCSRFESPALSGYDLGARG
jgi:hypothetical protein